MTHARRSRQGAPSTTPLRRGEGPVPADTLPRRLEVVLKADTHGTLEAAVAALAGMTLPGASIALIGRAVGDVSQSDLAMALTGSRLVVGFDVDVSQRCAEFARAHGVEVRLYDVVDRLVRDVGQIAGNLMPAPPQERILGQARVVALFKSTRRGIILGCEVLHGELARGMSFRVIEAPGPVYSGVIESLHIERDAVARARPGQKVGLKILDFHQGRVGDLVECFETVRTARKPWTPTPGIVRVKA